MRAGEVNYTPPAVAAVLCTRPAAKKNRRTQRMSKHSKRVREQIARMTDTLTCTVSEVGQLVGSFQSGDDSLRIEERKLYSLLNNRPEKWI